MRIDLLDENGLVLEEIYVNKLYATNGARVIYLDVGCTERGDAVDLRT